jgi:hypothetical protein
MEKGFGWKSGAGTYGGTGTEDLESSSLQRLDKFSPCMFTLVLVPVLSLGRVTKI